MLRLGAHLAVVAALFSMLGACNQTTPANASSGPRPIRIDGSSTVLPMTQAVAAAFAEANPTLPPVTASESGTGGGFEKFCAGEIDIADASRPIGASEMVACFTHDISFVEVPVAFDAITLIVHPSQRVRTMTLQELRQIWLPNAEGLVANWNDVNANWPTQPLQLFGPGAASGTFDYFTEAVVGARRVSRRDYTASEHDAVIVDGVANDPNALGYVGLAHYERNKTRLAALAIDAGAGPVAPSSETVLNGQYTPLSRPLFLYVNAAALDRPEIRQFVEYYITNAARFAEEVGYVPLPPTACETYLQRVREKRRGTAFAGRSELGASIEQVIARPLNEE